MSIYAFQVFNTWIEDPSLVFPEQVNVLAVQPVSHGLVHVIPTLVVGIWQFVQDLVTQAVLSCSKVLVALGVLVQFLFGESWGVLSVNCDDLVFLVEKLDVLCLPLAVLDLRKEDEAAVALDVAWNALEVVESLRDRSLHLADTPLLG